MLGTYNNTAYGACRTAKRLLRTGAYYHVWVGFALGVKQPWLVVGSNELHCSLKRKGYVVVGWFSKHDLHLNSTWLRSHSGHCLSY